MVDASPPTADARYSLNVLLRGRTHVLELSDRSADTALAALRELVGDDQARVRLIHKGRKIDLDGPLDLVDGAKVGLVVSRAEDLASLQSKEAEDRRREEVMRTRKTVTPRSTHTSASIATLQNAPGGRFGRITPFPDGPATPFLDRRRQMLERLSTDPAIVEICNARDFRVGELTELHPHRDPTLLGLNRNAGESIALRLLTDRLDGLRSYNHVRRVLCHELAHNVHGPHELPFLELDSAIAKSVVAYYERERRSGHRLGGDIDGPVFDPEAHAEAARMSAGSACTTSAVSSTASPDVIASPQRLGGPSTDSASDARRAAADAAERRRSGR